MILLLVSLSILTACKSDEYIVYKNTTDNTRQEVLAQLDNILDKTEMLLPSDHVSDSFIMEYPLLMNQLTFVNIDRVIDQHTFTSGVLLHNTLYSIRQDLFSSNSYSEDTWKEVSNDQENYQYRLFANEGTLTFQYYTVDQDKTIFGFHCHVSAQDNVLEYTMNSISYDYKNDLFFEGQQSHYKEEEFYVEKSLLQISDSVTEIQYIEFLLQEKFYKNVYVFDVDGAPATYKIETYNPYEDQFTKMSISNNEEESIEIIQYDEIGQEVFHTNRNQEYFNFEFNLKFVYGWEEIKKLRLEDTLYSDQNVALKLPDNVYITITPEKGPYLSGVLIQGDPTSKFNLFDATMYAPVDYDYYLYLEDQSRLYCSDVLDESMEHDAIDIEFLYEEILHYLYVEEFYGMSKDFIN